MKILHNYKSNRIENFFKYDDRWNYSTYEREQRKQQIIQFGLNVCHFLS